MEDLVTYIRLYIFYETPLYKVNECVKSVMMEFDSLNFLVLTDIFLKKTLSHLVNSR